MEGIGFLLFVGSLWLAYKTGHSAGKITGERAGVQKGYDEGVLKGARAMASAFKNPDALEREHKVRQIVDAEFGDDLAGYVWYNGDINIDDEKCDYVMRLSDGRLIPVNNGLILTQSDDLTVQHVTPEVYELDHPLEKYESGKYKGQTKIFQEKPTIEI